jgi:uncharacterized membrane protein
MSRHRPSPSWRERLPGRRTEKYFRWRGQEVSRIENLTDAVFGFALTLLVVSTEVPQNYESLLRIFRDFPAFAACFAILLLFWNDHYKFFRRYGLEDFFTRTINYVILLLVLFSVYPLKFLFTTWLGSGTRLDSLEQLYSLYRIYGLGFATIWLLYAALQTHALRQAAALKLTPVEVVMSRLQLNEFRLQIGVCLLSVSLTYMSVPPWLPGITYALIGPLAGFNGWWHGRQVSRLLAQERVVPIRPLPV